VRRTAASKRGRITSIFTVSSKQTSDTRRALARLPFLSHICSRTSCSRTQASSVDAARGRAAFESHAASARIARGETRQAPLVIGTLVAAVLCASRAKAYRPFDGTDADVAGFGSFELELGPVHWYDYGGQQFLLAPVTVLNFGIVPDAELVIDFQGSTSLGPLEERPRTALLGTDVMLKYMLHDGALQGKPGLSAALELGILTPEVSGTDRFGTSAGIIVSHRSDCGSIHFNQWASFTRDRRLGTFSGAIVEGPDTWPVRPVSELFYAREFGAQQTVSALLGNLVPASGPFVRHGPARRARRKRERRRISARAHLVARRLGQSADAVSGAGKSRAVSGRAVQLRLGAPNQAPRAS